MYVADDGTAFGKERDAWTHERLELHGEWYGDNRLHIMSERDCISWREFLNWAITHRERVSRLMFDIDLLHG